MKDKIIKMHVKKILNKILVKYDDIISKEVYNIENYIQIKYDIRLIDE